MASVGGSSGSDSCGGLGEGYFRVSGGSATTPGTRQAAAALERRWQGRPARGREGALVPRWLSRAIALSLSEGASVHSLGL